MSITAREKLRSRRTRHGNADLDMGADSVIKLDRSADPLMKVKIVGDRQRVFEGRSESAALMIASLMQQ